MSDNPRIEQLAAEMRKQTDNVCAFAVGVIEAFARPGLTDAEVASGVRDALAALNLVLAERAGGTR